MAAYVVDQVAKYLAVRHLEGRAPVDVIGSRLQLQLLRNPGAAFSTGESLTPLISVVALAAAVAVVVFALRVRHRVWAVALGLLLAGIVGNLTDRIVRAPGPFRGHVVDFLALPHWPVFNVADICIDVAGSLVRRPAGARRPPRRQPTRAIGKARERARGGRAGPGDPRQPGG